nr:hypothetical protein [Shigella flexneri]
MAAGWLIDQCQLKGCKWVGLRCTVTGVSSHYEDNAKSEDVVQLAHM